MWSFAVRGLDMFAFRVCCLIVSVPFANSNDGYDDETAPTVRGECVRLKNFVINANITDNTIQHCGLYDFEFAGNSTTSGKNGEGIYVGTSSNQVGGVCGVGKHMLLYPLAPCHAVETCLVPLTPIE